MKEGWLSLGGALVSGAAAASWGDHEVQVFALFPDGELWNRYWDGESWHAWESLGGTFTGQPAAAARGAERIDVMAIGADGLLRHRWWDGRRWVSWQEVEGAPKGAGAVDCSWVGDRLDVFVQGERGELWYLALEG
jgi:hypothetical protein